MLTFRLHSLLQRHTQSEDQERLDFLPGATTNLAEYFIFFSELEVGETYYTGMHQEGNSSELIDVTTLSLPFW